MGSRMSNCFRKCTVIKDGDKIFLVCVVKINYCAFERGRKMGQGLWNDTIESIKSNTVSSL